MNKFITLEERNRIADGLRRDQAPLRPASIDEAVDGKISYADLEKGLTIRFPFVDGMRVGGRYHVSMSGFDGTVWGLGGTIQEENQDTVVAVPTDRALFFQGQEARLYYFYLEFEEGATSPDALFSIEGQIYKPIVDEAVDGVIPLAVLSQGVNLRIRMGLSMTPGALVSVYWWGTNADSCFVKHLVVGPDLIEDMVVRVEPAYLTTNKHGDIRVIYTVQSEAGSDISRLLELKAAGELAKPALLYLALEEVLLGAIPEPVLEDGSIPMGIATQGMVVGDVAILFFETFHEGSEFVLRHTVRDTDIAAGQIKFAVPAPFFYQGFTAKAWSIVHRQSGEAVGSPGLHLGFVDSLVRRHLPRG
jgi:hypothetical protein